MFITYYSNQLEKQKEILISLLEQLPLDDPFQSEIVLVQSTGMAQWLQIEIAKEKQVAMNFNFIMPASFIWQLYADNLPEFTTQENPFNKETMAWHLMQIIPQYLDQEAFLPLKKYLDSSPKSQQQKLYQLSLKIADLFDQYLVFRPDWILAWEKEQDELILSDVTTTHHLLQQHIKWQGILWRKLIQVISMQMKGGEQVYHRANLHQNFLLKLKKNNHLILPERIFIFGISTLPKSYLNIFQAISPYCDIHLFFNNPCEQYWGDIRDIQRILTLHQRQNYAITTSQTLFDPNSIQKELETTYYDEQIIIGNPLLASWGKMGRDFLYLLVKESDDNLTQFIDAYQPIIKTHLLSQLQAQILTLSDEPFSQPDTSIQIHSCHSVMREVEVLQDYLLSLFNDRQDITPKDIVVMVADINQYTPYIQAVFGQNPRAETAIPFSISDNNLAESDILLSSFIQLLNLKENLFIAEDILALLEIPAIRQKFNINVADIPQIRHWVQDSGIRFGLTKTNETQEKNYNSWQAGLERMLLGYALREEQGIWQDSLGLNESYGLKAQLVGQLSAFLDKLHQWQQYFQQSYAIEKWHQILTALLDDFFIVNDETQYSLLFLQDCIDQFNQELESVNFKDNLQIEIVADVLQEKLNKSPNSVKFLAGKVNFCTLLPMRSIPFKVVCLLGMNEADYPRNQTPNSFDLMQYHHQKGDRSRRDDDRYLFLEALLSAKEQLYISYVGRSIIDNQIKEPSILVTQLVDYINENLDKGEITIQQHSMTAFSPNNFIAPARSFAQQWLPLIQSNTPMEDFEQPLINNEVIEEINIADLVKFVEHPVQYFFKNQLGVYFNDLEDNIAESENFSLPGLTRYEINNHLLAYEPTDFKTYFQQLKIKGIMPRGEFANLAAQEIEQEVLAFQQKIQDFIHPKTDYVELIINLPQGKIKLFGYLEHLFGDNQQCIEWHFANNKDYYRIRPWIYYLIQLITQKNVISPLLFVKNLKQPIQFNAISIGEATELLEIYVSAFLANQHHIQFIPTANISSFFIDGDTSNSMELNQDKIVTELRKLILTNDYQRADVYWERVLTQSGLLNDAEKLVQLGTNTHLWFGKMMGESKKTKK